MERRGEACQRCKKREGRSFNPNWLLGFFLASPPPFWVCFGGRTEMGRAYNDIGLQVEGLLPSKTWQLLPPQVLTTGRENIVRTKAILGFKSQAPRVEFCLLFYRHPGQRKHYYLTAAVVLWKGCIKWNSQDKKRMWSKLNDWQYCDQFFPI